MPQNPRPSPARGGPPDAEAAAARRRVARRARGLLWRGRYVVAAACCALAAALVVQALRPAPPPTVEVVVPAHRLVAGKKAGASDLETRTVPAALAPDGVLTDPRDAVGRAPAVALPAGLPLHAALLSGGEVAAQAPEGTVVVPVRLDDTAAGWLRPGDRVDLLSRVDDAASGRDGGARAPAERDYLARRALVLPRPATANGETGVAGGLLGTGGTGGAAGDGGITLVAVSPEDAPGLSAASGWGTVGAVLVP
ncbi:SAF domain-containing protein [Isoptericola sp. BMS4]|uniref:SAF domain-containing protein n=1 Tax=Isoptericola sp. BMS4 TaxID=2527875 RepID=UPI001423FDF3|nr:SAF domain-containing protein [Isoptericola sp. BMS4]